MFDFVIWLFLGFFFWVGLASGWMAEWLWVLCRVTNCLRWLFHCCVGVGASFMSNWAPKWKWMETVHRDGPKWKQMKWNQTRLDGWNEWRSWFSSRVFCLIVGYSLVNLVELCFDGAGGWGDFDELVDWITKWTKWNQMKWMEEFGLSRDFVGYSLVDLVELCFDWWILMGGGFWWVGWVNHQMKPN